MSGIQIAIIAISIASICMSTAAIAITVYWSIKAANRYVGAFTPETTSKPAKTADPYDGPWEDR